MDRFALVVAASAITFVACDRKTPEIRKPAPKPAIAATPDNSGVRTFNGRGVVTKINLESVSVELNHEEIKGLMPAMIMEFYAKEKGELEVLKVGDKVDFLLEDNAGQEKIVKITKR